MSPSSEPGFEDDFRTNSDDCSLAGSRSIAALDVEPTHTIVKHSHDQKRGPKTAREPIARQLTFIHSRIGPFEAVSQTELSKKLGVPDATLSALRRGKGKNLSASITDPRPAIMEWAYARVSHHIPPFLIRTYDLLEMMRRDESPYSHITSFAVGALDQVNDYIPNTAIQRGMASLVRGELQFSIRRYFLGKCPPTNVVSILFTWSPEDIRREFDNAVREFYGSADGDTADAFETIFCALALDRLLVFLFFINKDGIINDEIFVKAIKELGAKWNYSRMMDAADALCPSWSRALNTAELHAVCGNAPAARRSFNKAKNGNDKLVDVLHHHDDTAWISKWLCPMIAIEA
jgi:hypothetical protein